MSDTRSTAIWVAVIGLIGALGAAIIQNWPKRSASHDGEKSASATPYPSPNACIPSLAVPVRDAVLSQHRLDDGRVESNWMFGWRACPEASRYHLFVIGPSALNPIVNEDSIESATYQYRHTAFGPVTQTDGWSWKVRAFVDGGWGEWSEERRFSVGREE